MSPSLSLFVQSKCWLYYPDDENQDDLHFDDIHLQVTFLSEKQHRHFTERRFQLTHLLVIANSLVQNYPSLSVQCVHLRQGNHVPLFTGPISNGQTMVLPKVPSHSLSCCVPYAIVARSIQITVHPSFTVVQVKAVRTRRFHTLVSRYLQESVDLAHSFSWIPC